jgi:hypothetical protein
MAHDSKQGVEGLDPPFCVVGVLSDVCRPRQCRSDGEPLVAAQYAEGGSIPRAQPLQVRDEGVEAADGRTIQFHDHITGAQAGALAWATCKGKHHQDGMRLV